jgi:hypothetical protein
LICGQQYCSAHALQAAFFEEYGLVSLQAGEPPWPPVPASAGAAPPEPPVAVDAPPEPPEPEPPEPPCPPAALDVELADVAGAPEDDEHATRSDDRQARAPRRAGLMLPL